MPPDARPKRGGGRPAGGSQKALMDFRKAIAATDALVAFVELTAIANEMVKRGEAASISAALVELMRAHEQLLDRVREMLESLDVEPRLTAMEGQLRAIAGMGDLLRAAKG